MKEEVKEETLTDEPDHIPMRPMRKKLNPYENDCRTLSPQIAGIDTQGTSTR